MLLKAKRKYRIDFEKSFMIGDTWRDIKMGNDCMCKTILIERNKLKSKKGYAKRSSSLERTETDQKNQQNIEKDSVSQQELD